jgi:hypothetical protein
MVKVVWETAVAVFMIVVFFLVRSAMSPEHALSHGWYIAHGDGIWYQLICVAGFVIAGGSAIRTFVNLSHAGQSPGGHVGTGGVTSTGSAPLGSGQESPPEAGSSVTTPPAPGEARADTRAGGRQTEDW